MTQMGKYLFFGQPAPIPQPAARKKSPLYRVWGYRRAGAVSNPFFVKTASTDFFKNENVFGGNHSILARIRTRALASRFELPP